MLAEAEVRFGLEHLSGLVMLTPSELYPAVRDLRCSFLPHSTCSRTGMDPENKRVVSGLC